MPRVDVELRIAASPDQAWAAVADVESYPGCMDNVESVTVIERGDDRHRTTARSVRLLSLIII